MWGKHAPFLNNSWKQGIRWAQTSKTKIWERSHRNINKQSCPWWQERLAFIFGWQWPHRNMGLKKSEIKNFTSKKTIWNFWVLFEGREVWWEGGRDVWGKHHGPAPQASFSALQAQRTLKEVFSCWILAYLHRLWRRQWHPTPVILPGKSHGQRSLVGCSPWGCWGSDTIERLHSLHS